MGLSLPSIESLANMVFLTHMTAWVIVDVNDVLSGEGTPPGHPKIWETVRAKIQLQSCRHVRRIVVGWDHDSQVPSQDLWQDLLGFAGRHQLLVSHGQSNSLGIEVRSRFHGSDALETLVLEAIASRGLLKPRTCWTSDFYQFHALDSAALLQSLRSVLALGDRSSVYDSAYQEARILEEKSELEWPRLGEIMRLSADPSASPVDAFVHSVQHGAWVAWRKRLSILEKRPGHAPESFVSNPARSPQFSNDFSRDLLTGPVLFGVNLAPQADRYSSAAALAAQMDRHCSLADRSFSTLISFFEPALKSSIAPLCRLPLHHGSLPPAPSAEHRLFALGAWSLKNPLQHRRVEWMLSNFDPQALSCGEGLDGDQDWLAYLGSELIRLGGWTLSHSEFSRLVKECLGQSPGQLLWLFWSDRDPTEWSWRAADCGTQVFCFGKPSQEFIGMRLVEGEQIVEELSSERLGVNVSQEARDAQSATWVVPDVKAPVFGFERAALFPDQFLLKVTKRRIESAQFDDAIRLLQGRSEQRSLLTENEASRPLRGSRWSLGAHRWAEAWAYAGEELWIDPRFAGMNLVDKAFRNLLAQGPNTLFGSEHFPQGECLVTLWLPDANSMRQPLNQEQQRELDTVLQLCRVGVADYFAAWPNQPIVSMQTSPMVGFSSKPGAYLQIMSPLIALESKGANPIPGIRMHGEAMYVLGPRPSFVEAGSRILSHVRVVSNYVSQLSPWAQRDLYRDVTRWMQRGWISSIRPVEDAGLAGAVGEMALWSKIGVLVRPNISTIELFSGSPGRVLLGVLPHFQKEFETVIPKELTTFVGHAGGEKILGLPLASFVEERSRQVLGEPS